MSDVLKLTARLLFDGKQFDAGLKGAERQADKTATTITKRFENLAANLEKVGTRMSTALTAPLAAFGALTIRTAANFESSMNRVRATTGATGESFERLNRLAQELGATTAFSASEAALAMNALAQAGFNVDQITSALPGVLQLAAAGAMSLEEAAGIAANTLTSFGLEASEVGRVNDVLAKGAISANTNVREMAAGFNYVAPIAKGLGFNLEETTAAMTQLARAGITSTTAGTALRSIMTQLVTEADDLGISVRDSAGNMRPFADILAQLEARGYSAEEAMMQFGETGGPGLTALLGLGTAGLRDMETALLNAGGTAAELAAVQMEGFNGKIAELRSAFEALQIAIANSGLLEFAGRLVARLTEFLLAVSKLNPETLKTITIIGAIAASIGPLILGIGKGIEAFLALQRAVTTIRTAMIALRVVMLGMMGPVGWVIAGVTALVSLGAAFVIARNRNKEFAEQAKATEEAARLEAEQIETVNAALENMDSTITRVIVPINDMVKDINESSGSIADLRAAVNRAAAGMSGEGAAAFKAFADQAIASGADLKTVAGRIADRAQRDSLLSKVNELAAGMVGNGRQAFIDYAKEAIATSETSQDALTAIMRAWTATQNAAAIAAAESRKATIISAQAIRDARIQDLNNQIAETEPIVAGLRAELEAMEEGGAKVQFADGFRVADEELQRAKDTVERLTNTMATARTQLAEVETQLGVLKGTTEIWNRTTVVATESGVVPLTGAVGDLSDEAKAAAGSLAAARQRVKELEEALEATADSDTRIRISLDLEQARAELAALIASFSPIRVPLPKIEVTNLLSLATASARAAEEIVRLRRAQEELGQATREDVIRAQQNLVASLTRARSLTREGAVGYNELTQALSQATRELAAMTSARDTEAREIRLQNALAERDLEISNRIATSGREEVEIQAEKNAAMAAAMRLHLGYSEGLVGTAADATASAEAQLQLAEALVSVGEATEERVIMALTGLRAALLQERSALDPYSQAYAVLTERLAATSKALRDLTTARDAEARALRLRMTLAEQDLELSNRIATSAREETEIIAERNRLIAQAMSLNLGYREGLVGTAADAVAFAETQVRLNDALLAAGEVTETRVISSLLGLRAALQQSREELSPYSLEYAILTERLTEVQGRLDELGDANLSTARTARVAAGNAAELAVSLNAVKAATNIAAITSLNAYADSLRSEMALVGENTAAYAELRIELERVLALRAALSGGLVGKAGGGDKSAATGAAALREGIESFSKSLGASSEAAAKFAGNIMDQVPLLGAAAGGWMDLLLGLLTSTEGFGDLMEAMNGILNPIIAVLETLFPPLIELVNALTPVIQVIAALVNVALQPFLFVITKILTPAITFVANLIVTIWNAIANALNAILGVFGVKIPTIDRGGPGGGGTDSADQRILGESGGVQVRLDSTGGQPYLIYTADAAPAGSIARQRSVVSALRQAFDNATNDGERSRIQSVLTREEATLNRMTGQETTPTGPTEPEAPRGRIGRLEARRRELQTLINESDSEEDIARYNAELRTVDTEINRLRGLGTPADEAPPEEPAPSGLLPSLRAERAALARQLDTAETPEEIARINDQIRDVDARINELQDLTLRPPEEQEPEAQGLIMRLEAERRGLQDQLMRAETPAEIARLNDGIRAIDAQLSDLRALTNDLPEEIGDEVGDEVEEPLERLSPDFSFGGTAQSVQLAVATPLLDASIRMLEASQNMQRIFGAVGPDGAPGFSALPAFNSAIERMTPVLERLLSEGVSINVGGAAPATGGSSTAYLRGV